MLEGEGLLHPGDGDRQDAGEDAPEDHGEQDGGPPHRQDPPDHLADRREGLLRGDLDDDAQVEPLHPLRRRRDADALFVLVHEGAGLSPAQAGHGGKKGEVLVPDGVDPPHVGKDLSPGVDEKGASRPAHPGPFDEVPEGAVVQVPHQDANDLSGERLDGHRDGGVEGGDGRLPRGDRPVGFAARDDRHRVPPQRVIRNVGRGPEGGNPQEERPVEAVDVQLPDLRVFLEEALQLEAESLGVRLLRGEVLVLGFRPQGPFRRQEVVADVAGQGLGDQLGGAEGLGPDLLGPHADQGQGDPDDDEEGEADERREEACGEPVEEIHHSIARRPRRSTFRPRGMLSRFATLRLIVRE
ncbi:MAG: hypothetical protein ACE5IM_01275 [Nitrospinota bacterium]